MAELTDIAVGTFSSMNMLVTLKMSDNKKMQLSTGIFVGLKGLQALRLESNPQLAPSIKAGLFEGLSALQTLYLFNTGMTTIPKGLFVGLGNLNTLYMGENAITTIPDDSFALEKDELVKGEMIRGKQHTFLLEKDTMVPVEKLWLNDNKLGDLTGRPFKSLLKLKNLRLDGNKIGAISDTVISDAESLQYLFLHKNKLESISNKLFTSNMALVYIYLQNNQIAAVHAASFHGLTNLRIVALDNNKIASLKNAAFKDSQLDHHAFKKNIPVHLHGNPVALEISRPCKPQKGRRVTAKTFKTLGEEQGTTALVEVAAGGSLFEIESGITAKKSAKGKKSPFVDMMKDSLAVSGKMEGCGKDPSSPCKTPEAKSLTSVFKSSVFEVVTIKPVGASNFRDTVAFAGKDLGVQSGDDPKDSLTSKMKVALSCDKACLEDEQPVMKFVNVYSSAKSQTKANRFAVAYGICRYKHKWSVFNPPLPDPSNFGSFADFQAFVQGVIQASCCDVFTKAGAMELPYVGKTAGPYKCPGAGVTSGVHKFESHLLYDGAAVAGGAAASSCSLSLSADIDRLKGSKAQCLTGGALIEAESMEKSSLKSKIKGKLASYMQLGIVGGAGGAAGGS